MKRSGVVTWLALLPLLPSMLGRAPLLAAQSAAKPRFEVASVKPSTADPLELPSGRPIPGALLQVLGTGFSTFADGVGHYRLRFDPDLVDACRTQLVRVTAPGYRTRTMFLGYGFTSDNAVDLPGR